MNNEDGLEPSDSESKKLNSGVKWPDQGNNAEPISHTIARSDMEKAMKAKDLKKITAHKRHPSNQLKPIIKKNNNFMGKHI